jgi:hypothetical protein
VTFKVSPHETCERELQRIGQSFQYGGLWRRQPARLDERFYVMAVDADGGRLLSDLRLARWVLGGLESRGDLRRANRIPMAPTLSSHPANTTTPARPDCLRDGNLPRGQRTIDRWYDVSALGIPAQFTFGNCGRHVLRTPGFTNLDLLIAREFRIAAGKRLELRAEVFNLTNAVHLGQPDLLIDQPQAGRMTSTQAPARQVQLGLRFVF